MKKNTIKIFSLVVEREKLMAVERNGAVQGVASNVANIPVKKLPRNRDLSALSRRLFSLSFKKLGRLISKSPSKFIANPKVITHRKIKNTGFWNCTPQPAIFPASLRLMVNKASIRNEEIIPRIVNKKLFLT